MTGPTRRPLPARVYWVRRLMLLGIAALLVVGFAQLLGGGSNGSSGADTATQAAARTTPSTNGPSTPTGSSTGRAHRHHRHHASASYSPVAMPSGPCADDDVSIAPSVRHTIAGQDVKIVLDLSTISSPACDWTLSGTSLALKITSGPDLIWTTVQCAHAIPTQDLVLRQGQPTRGRLTWNARRSAPGCPVQTDWALPGTYHLHVAALAGQPQDVTFALDLPTAPTITRTAHPHGHQHRHHTPPTR
jgi:hypothetical protein